MTKQKDLDMSAFIGSGFDCEFANKHEYGPEYSYCVSLRIDFLALVGVEMGEEMYVPKGSEFCSSEMCRPRLNKPQVLENIEAYKQVLVDGAVWRLCQPCTDKYVAKGVYSSQDIKNGLNMWTSYPIVWIEFIGIEVDSPYTNWAERNGVPILEVR